MNYSNQLFDKKSFAQYEYALKILETEINILMNDYAVNNNYNPVEHIKSRLKSPESIIRKLTSRGYEINEENIKNHVHDIVGIRIVCSFITDVYDIVSLLEKSDLIKITNRKNYIDNPKDTGYISYHLLVEIPVHLIDRTEYIEAEIQIRTVAMDFWASLDHKIRYKFKGQIPEEVSQKMQEYAASIKELDKNMLDLNYIVNKYKI